MYYETFYYQTDFSLEMYDRFLYQKYAIIAIIFALAISLLYYFVLDRPRFAKVSFWLTLAAVSALGSALFAYSNSHSLFVNEGLEFPDAAYFGIALANFVMTLLAFFLLSLGLRKLSKSLSKTPF